MLSTSIIFLRTKNTQKLLIIVTEQAAEVINLDDFKVMEI